MYTVRNNTAYINGSSGKYDQIVGNSSARYGRNAVDNHLQYLKSLTYTPVKCDAFIPMTFPEIKDGKIKNSDKFIKNVDENLKKVEDFIKKISKNLKKLPPINFELQYMPVSKPGEVDKNALMGASFEEMGQRHFISVDDMNRQLNPAGQAINIDAGAVDLNHDNYIDIGEYASTILLSDMLSADENNYSIKNINGKITNKGENALLRNSGDREMQYTAYKYLYDYYNLGQAKKGFIKNPNNCRVVN